MPTKNAPPRTLIDTFERSPIFGDQPFISYVDDLDSPPTESLTYAEFYARAETIAANLHAHGVRAGDPIALIALPRVDYICAIAGAVLLGAIPAPINHHFKVRELTGTLDILRPRLIIVDGATSQMVETALARMSDLTAVAGISGHTGGIDLNRHVQDRDFPRSEATERDPALILHSSGTTGLPKLVVRSHGSIAAFLDLFTDYFGDDEHILNFLPLYHQAGLILNVLAACRLGIDVVQLSRYTTSGFWPLIDRYGATHVNLVSPMASFILSQPASDRDRGHSLRWMVVAGRNDHWSDFQDRFGVAGMTFYGSTETLQITSTGNPKNGPVSRELLDAAGSNIYTGPPITKHSEFRLRSVDGELIQTPLLAGQIETRGEYCFTEYLNQPELTAAAFTPDGWFRTGDLGYRTEAGALVLIGRESGMIRRSGENIAPREIELVLEDHGAIKEAIVIGVPDEARGQEVLARVVLEAEASLSASELFGYLEEHLSSFKVPRYVSFEEPFERTPTFKIKLRGLEEGARTHWHDRLAQ